MEKIRDTFQKFKEKVTSFINLIASFLFYLFGIGLTRIVSVFFGKSFIENKHNDSAWKKVKKSITLEKQY
jgi:hypothetical protein